MYVSTYVLLAMCVYVFVCVSALLNPFSYYYNNDDYNDDDNDNK